MISAGRINHVVLAASAGVWCVPARITPHTLDLFSPLALALQPGTHPLQ